MGAHSTPSQARRRHPPPHGGPSAEALALCGASDLLDLHVDSFIWTRVAGYSLARAHGAGAHGGRFFRQADLPRLTAAGFDGATWVITTNPMRGARGRAQALLKNVADLQEALARAGAVLVRTAADFRAARKEGTHAAFIGIQGGNALGHDPGVLDQLDPLTLLRITLVHLTDSNLGCTSSPARWGEDDGLRPFGHDCIAAMNDRRVLVDLAHISRKGFFDAAQAHRRDLPFVVTHTGVEGVYPHWRNLTDEQIRAVADSGGFVGIMYEIRFLGPGRSATRETIVDHLEHVIRVGGEHLPALGSDWDGCILTPPDMRTAAEFPLLVDSMLKRGWSTDRIERILGGNALGVIEAIRG